MLYRSHELAPVDHGGVYERGAAEVQRRLQAGPGQHQVPADPAARLRERLEPRREAHPPAGRAPGQRAHVPRVLQPRQPGSGGVQV